MDGFGAELSLASLDACVCQGRSMMEEFGDEPLSIESTCSFWHKEARARHATCVTVESTSIYAW